MVTVYHRQRHRAMSRMELMEYLGTSTDFKTHVAIELNGKESSDGKTFNLDGLLHLQAGAGKKTKGKSMKRKKSTAAPEAIDEIIYTKLLTCPQCKDSEILTPLKHRKHVATIGDGSAWQNVTH